MGGTITARSLPDGGAEFEFSLAPYVDVDEIAEPAIVESPALEAPAAAPQLAEPGGAPQLVESAGDEAGWARAAS